ncbi:MAG: trehalose-phosphatase [Candidatus Methylomirabilis oxyfera]|nr:trehalose-phosphatase [Candidatus Methylomirabilis oxyfera]
MKEQILKSGHTVLLLDYDGTLAPIAPSPEQSALPSSTRSVLQRLSRNPRVTVALISGRPLADLRQLVGVRNLTYVGNHGLETWHRGRRTSVAVPGRSREALSRLRPTLAGLVKDVPGARLEDKGLSLALHYRLAPTSQVARLKAGIRRAARPFVRSRALSLLNGRKIIEVRPGLNWTKGDAALRLVKRMRGRRLLPICIGDDRTDEDAFGALIDGITIRVGAHRGSKARYYVRNVREVAALLEWIATQLA